MRLNVPKLKLGVDASSTAVLSSRRSISEAYLFNYWPGAAGDGWVYGCLCVIGSSERRVVLRWASLAVSPPARPSQTLSAL
jgi:hypothetical protein